MDSSNNNNMPAIIQTKESRDEVIRSRLLHSLGIQKAKTSPSIGIVNVRDGSLPSNQMQRPANIKMNLLSEDAPIRRSLNDSEEYKSRQVGKVMKGDRQKRHVRFNSIVTEKEIASHKKYSDRIKRTLWSDSEEIKENAYRNQIEYQAEGMNWESVLENDEMYMDANTGELIHPFWVENQDSNLFS